MSEEYICPITNEKITKCGMLITGHIFEYDAIVRWLEDNKTNPMTNKKLLINKVWELGEISQEIILKYRNKIKDETTYGKNNCRECLKNDRYGMNCNICYKFSCDDCFNPDRINCYMCNKVMCKNCYKKSNCCAFCEDVVICKNCTKYELNYCFEKEIMICDKCENYFCDKYGAECYFCKGTICNECYNEEYDKLPKDDVCLTCGARVCNKCLFVCNCGDNRCNFCELCKVCKCEPGNESGDESDSES